MIPRRTGNIETTDIKQFLDELEVVIGEEIYMGDFDIMGFNLASKIRDRDEENYKTKGAVFRPNFERGILLHSLIVKKNLTKCLFFQWVICLFYISSAYPSMHPPSMGNTAVSCKLSARSSTSPDR